MQKIHLFRRSADFECAPGSSPEHIDFPWIDNIRHYLEAEIVNVYKSIGKTTIFSRRRTSECREASWGEVRRGVLSYRLVVSS